MTKVSLLNLPARLAYRRSNHASLGPIYLNTGVALPIYITPTSMFALPKPPVVLEYQSRLETRPFFFKLRPEDFEIKLDVMYKLFWFLVRFDK
jgi:hypothetical protein